MTQTQTPSDSRSREHSWDDPAIALTSLPTLSGMEFLQAMVEGRVPSPPISSTLDFADFTVERGSVTVELDPAEFHMNPLGTRARRGHRRPAGHRLRLRGAHHPARRHRIHQPGSEHPVPAPGARRCGRIRCVGTVLTAGSRTATAEAKLLDARDRLLAHATSTCLIFPIGPPVG